MLFSRSLMKTKTRPGAFMSSRSRSLLFAVLGVIIVGATAALILFGWTGNMVGRRGQLLSSGATGSNSDWSFDEDMTGAALQLSSDDDYSRKPMQGWDQLESFEKSPAVIAALSELQAAPQVVTLSSELRKNGVLGWCNSPHADPQGSCRVVECMRSVKGLPLDLGERPFWEVTDHARASKCLLPLGGQRPYVPGMAVQVSFMLTLHNNDRFAAKALLELFRTSQEAVSVQYTVYDDASDSLPVEVIATLSALRHSFGALVQFNRGEGSLGFGAANHEAILASNGTYIVLVNTDMYVTPGWLAALLYTVHHIPRAGLVGPMYIGDNGLVTEAGGIVFGDAGAANFGRGFSPSSHEFAYARRVDYISAACVLMSRRLYFALGGFDPRYEMGYYEDTDLALAVRKAGMFVFYQPGAIVFHQEGNTLGTDESPLKQRLMKENRAKFAEKWHSLLSSGYLLSNAPLPQAAVQRYPGRVLWILNQIPEPLRDMGTGRSLLLLKVLLEVGFHVQVQLLSKRVEPSLMLQMRILGADVVEPRPMSEWQLSSSPISCTFHLFVVSDSRTMQAARDGLRTACPHTPVMYDAQSLRTVHAALHHLESGLGLGQTAEKAASWIKSIGAQSTLYGQWEQEARVIQDAAVTVVQSQLEADVLAIMTPQAKVALLPLVQQAAFLPKTPSTSSTPPLSSAVASRRIGDGNPLPSDCLSRRMTLLVVAGWEASSGLKARSSASQLDSLVIKIMELLWFLLTPNEQADFSLHLVAGPAPLESDADKRTFAWSGTVKRHHSGQTHSQGLGELLAESRVLLAPLLPEDLGFRDLVLQGVTEGLPLVSTPAGLHLLGLDKQSAVGAETAHAFAQSLLRLLRCGGSWPWSPSWSSLSQAGQRLGQEPSGPLSSEEGHRAAVKMMQMIRREIQ